MAKKKSDVKSNSDLCSQSLSTSGGSSTPPGPVKAGHGVLSCVGGYPTGKAPKPSTPKIILPISKPNPDLKFLESLSEPDYLRVFWFSENPPRPRSLKSIYQDPYVAALWRKQRFFNQTEKIFPPYKTYSFCCKKVGTVPVPPFKFGVPLDISASLTDNDCPPSRHKILKTLYIISYYHNKWKMRIVEPSVGLLISLTDYSDRTVKYCLAYFRKYYYARKIWRGKPAPEDPRYLHSCYELPLNMRHVTSWKINHGRKRNKK